MNIKKHGLRFHGSFTYRNRTDEIIWHHAEANCTVEDIHSWHLNNGWIGCGYNLIIYKDGTVHEGRPLNAVGAHASGHNSRSIGVCCIGRYDIETMPLAQLNAAKQVQAYLKGLYPGAATKRHKDVNATSCPGKNFPFSEIVGTAGNASTEASAAGQGTLLATGTRACRQNVMRRDLAARRWMAFPGRILWQDARNWEEIQEAASRP